MPKQFAAEENLSMRRDRKHLSEEVEFLQSTVGSEFPDWINDINDINVMLDSPNAIKTIINLSFTYHSGIHVPSIYGHFMANIWGMVYSKETSAGEPGAYESHLWFIQQGDGGSWAATCCNDVLQKTELWFTGKWGKCGKYCTVMMAGCYRW